MTVADDQRSTEKLVLRALIISILLHFLIYFGYRIGQAEGWWTNLAMPRWMQAAAHVLMPTIPKTPLAVTKPKEMQLVFVQTDPMDEVQKPPEKPKFEGAHNTVAANPKIVKPSDMPDIEGRQTKVLKTVPEAKPAAPPPQPVQPTPQEHPQVAVKPKPVKPVKPQEHPLVAAKPKPVQPAQPAPLEHPQIAVKPVEPQKSYVPGDLASVRPLEKPRDTATDVARPLEKPQDASPDTDTEAETPAQLHPNRPRRLGAVEHEGTVGEQAKLAGGVPHIKLTGSSLDVKGTVWGNYEEVMVDAISSQWHMSLENISWNASGKVLVEFRLYPDGHVERVVIKENGVTDELATFCAGAIIKPSPFGPWPREMRLDIPADYLLLQFTFYYDLE